MPGSPEHERLVALQRAFSAAIRDPGRPAPPGVPDARMRVYQTLFFNGFDGHLSNNFPVLRELLDDTEWQALVRDFMQRHRCRTPLFTELGSEFVAYLEHEREPDPERPFLAELAHYEHVELEVAIDPRGDHLPPHDPEGDPFTGCPVTAPALRILGYHFPVHRIGPDFQPREPGPAATHLVVYRDTADAVRFLEINPVTRHLLERLARGDATSGRACIEEIAAALDHPDPDAVLDAGRAMLDTLRRHDVLIGTRREVSAR